MHELSIAQSILDIVHQYVPTDRSNTVKSVKLRVGELSGVVADSLEFCFSAIVADTPLRGTTLDIERIPFTLHCKQCENTFTSEYGIVICPKCGSDSTEVIAGTEMQVVEIELRENGSG
jgi:hydrogenase nickel incorporation protein HypA/HybF